MKFSSASPDQYAAITALVQHCFATSASADEGLLIATLTADIFASVAPGDLHVFVAQDDVDPLAAILFTRLRYPEETRDVFVLGPVAVHPDRQRQGIGQGLVMHGLAGLRSSGVDVVLTYGDPRYYTKTGFQQISEDHAKAPMPLQFPHGWMGQSLIDAPFTPLRGPSFCVEAFNNPKYW